MLWACDVNLDSVPCGKKAHCYVWFSDCGKATGKGVVESRRHQLLPNPCESGCDELQTEVAHEWGSSAGDSQNGCPLSLSASCSRVDLVANVDKIFAPERCQLILPVHPFPLDKSLSDRSMHERQPFLTRCSKAEQTPALLDNSSTSMLLAFAGFSLLTAVPTRTLCAYLRCRRTQAVRYVCARLPTASTMYASMATQIPYAAM